MFIILLRFTEKIDKAPQYKEEHNAWLRRGFSDRVFLAAGTLEPKQGGCILAAENSIATLKNRVKKDPFVRENIVDADVLEITLSKTSEDLKILMNSGDEK